MRNCTPIIKRLCTKYIQWFLQSVLIIFVIIMIIIICNGIFKRNLLSEIEMKIRNSEFLLKVCGSDAKWQLYCSMCPFQKCLKAFRRHTNTQCENIILQRQQYFSVIIIIIIMLWFIWFIVCKCNNNSSYNGIQSMEMWMEMKKKYAQAQLQHL